MKNAGKFFAGLVMLFVLAGVYVPADAQVVIAVGHHHHRHCWYSHHHRYCK